jgi:hypothetical protein
VKYYCKKYDRKHGLETAMPYFKHAVIYRGEALPRTGLDRPTITFSYVLHWQPDSNP